MLVHLETSVFWTSQEQARFTPDLAGWDEPLSAIGYENEEEVIAARLEGLDSSAPALITTLCNKTDRESTVAEIAGRLDLNPEVATVTLGDQIDIRTMAKRDPHAEAIAGEPLCRRHLTDVALSPRIQLLETEHEPTFAGVSDRKLRRLGYEIIAP